jgi:NhaP-type Na+/H+ or K+/H+ antiporter
VIEITIRPDHGIGNGPCVSIMALATIRFAVCANRGWITETWRQLPVPALAVTCFAVAQWLSGSGFIACFVGGMPLRADEKLFMGWFGPRGLARIVFAVIVIENRLPNSDILSMTIACTILLSVLAHGLSAHPLVAALANRAARSMNNPMIRR